MFAADFLPAVVRDNGADVLYVAGLVAAVGAMAATPFVRRPVKWLWRRIIAEPLGTWGVRTVRAAMAPDLATLHEQITATRRASKEQHDEQNGRLGQIERRLNDGSQTMGSLLDIAANIDGRVADIDAWRARWEGLTPGLDDAAGVLHKWKAIDSRLAALENDNDQEDPPT